MAQTKPTKSVDETTAASHASLPAERAFVLQLRSDADPGRGIVRGRVEHIVSGDAAPFESVDDLCGFVRRALKSGPKSTL